MSSALHAGELAGEPAIGNSFPSDAQASYRPDIDGLRAVAVLAVLAFHAAERVAPGGFVGVDVFFVISGFLISSIILKGLQKGRFSFRDFYVRRVRRIFPALIVVLVASLLLGWFLLEPEPYAMLGKHVAAGAGFVSNIVNWTESGYFDPPARSKALLHLWSLGVEEQFYLLWPLLLWLMWKTRFKVLLWILAVSVISFVLNIGLVNGHPSASFYLPFTRFWELLAGGALAYMSLYNAGDLKRYRLNVLFTFRRIDIPLREVAAFAGLLLIIASVFGLSEKSGFPGWWALVPTIGAVLVIFAGEQSWVNRVLLSNKGMMTVGLISYPLYLWHWPLLFFGQATSLGEDYHRTTIAAMIVLAFVLSLATYHFIEKPLRYGVAMKREWVTAGLLGSIAFLAMLGIIVDVRHGGIDRFPEQLRPFLDYSFDYKTFFRSDRCLLSGDEQAFAEECSGGLRNGSTTPLILIWGDSHGAMLYHALSEVAQPQGIGVAQYTSSSCPPILGFEKIDRPLCRRINDLVFGKVVELHPATVVLAHDWLQSLDEDALRMLPETVAALRRSGVQRIILVGPVPHWKSPLHTEMFRVMRRTNSVSVPERMHYGLFDSVEGLDSSLASTARKLMVNYVSPYRCFCNTDGCLVTIGSENSKDLTAFDEAHLTATAARFFISNNLDSIFGASSQGLKTP